MLSGIAQGIWPAQDQQCSAADLAETTKLPQHGVRREACIVPALIRPQDAQCHAYMHQHLARQPTCACNPASSAFCTHQSHHHPLGHQSLPAQVQRGQILAYLAATRAFMHAYTAQDTWCRRQCQHRGQPFSGFCLGLHTYLLQR